MVFRYTKNLAIESIAADRALVTLNYSDCDQTLELTCIFEQSSRRILYADVKGAPPSGISDYSSLIRAILGLCIGFDIESRHKLLTRVGKENAFFANLLLESGLALERIQGQEL